MTHIMLCRTDLLNDHQAQGSVTFAIQDCTTPSSLCMWVEPLTVTAAPGTARIDDSNYWYPLPMRMDEFSDTDGTAGKP